VTVAPCLDCGADTLALGEWYLVNNDVWAEAMGAPPDVRFAPRGFLCIEHLEARLGRRLTAVDFTDVPINRRHERHSARLQARLVAAPHLTA